MRVSCGFLVEDDKPCELPAVKKAWVPELLEYIPCCGPCGEGRQTATGREGREERE